MYIHIGNARIVFKRELIGIFHMNLRDNPVNKQFLESANAENFYRNKELERYKSFIVTDSELLLSPIVPTTLARRQKRDR
ncbi:MAG: extracellular matrix/biofilm biosynthesis regulator RemA family protein [Dethiobacteria bacterium]|jgi:regulator of extracellular matrix RemA (YlzA/DUF370 family)|nr:DUF370 domain-containing protein [Bacillota bacterium]NMD32802.1 DUF370 domain-containing protein [Bacillota bacterium]HOB28673.1 DUF370 domain-containing protein [Bacillota bacterium]HPZ41361.1 DUF370 domain-containing protein [Bacillota bacterium]HQD52330.1 DUF370 domain-containing protein [Bacillota bacterium]